MRKGRICRLLAIEIANLDSPPIAFPPMAPPSAKLPISSFLLVSRRSDKLGIWPWGRTFFDNVFEPRAAARMIRSGVGQQWDCRWKPSQSGNLHTESEPIGPHRDERAANSSRPFDTQVSGNLQVAFMFGLMTKSGDRPSLGSSGAGDIGDAGSAPPTRPIQSRYLMLSLGIPGERSHSWPHQIDHFSTPNMDLLRR